MVKDLAVEMALKKLRAAVKERGRRTALAFKGIAEGQARRAS